MGNIKSNQIMWFLLNQLKQVKRCFSLALLGVIANYIVYFAYDSLISLWSQILSTN